MYYRKSLIFLIIVQTIFFIHVFIKGEVIFPHYNDIELGICPENDERMSNRKFSDQSSVFIPEINQHLNGNHRAWISTWNPFVQLGRPTFQGFGKAYLISHILSFCTNDPFIFNTALTVITVFLTGIFFFFFLKTIGLHPLACSSAAIGLSLGAFVSYWLTFVVFISTICWTVCLLWLIVKFLNKKTWFLALGIAFATYSLLMTSYPQSVILHLYLIVCFTLINLWKCKTSNKKLVYDALGLAGSVCFGLAMTLPVFIDLVLNAMGSARLSAGNDFFLAVLPKIHDIKKFGIYLGQCFDAFLVGNPIKSGYPLVFNGICLTPLYSILFLLSFVNGQWRKLWPWHFFCFVCLIGTIWPSAYLYAVKHLGFHLSRIQLIGGATIPAFIICAFSIDNLLRNGINRKLIPFLLTPLLIVLSLIWFPEYEKLQFQFVIVGSLLIFGTILLMIRAKPVLLQIMVIISVFAYGYSMILTRPLDQIQLSSPLVRKIKSEINGGFRYAKAGSVCVLPSNQEALLKINSIHSYDSLSSLNYQRLALKLSEIGTTTLGRYFNTIDWNEKLCQGTFSLLGVGCVLSTENLDENKLKKTAEINGINIFKTLSPAILEAQIQNYHRGKTDKEIKITGILEEYNKVKVEKVLSFDDYKHFKVNPYSKETVLFLSQQFHPQWKAFNKNDRLKTVIVNDFFEGVIIPPYVDEVILEFKPTVLWSWVPQVLFLMIGFGLLFFKVMKLFLKSYYNGAKNHQIQT